MGEFSFGSIVVATMGTNTEGNKKKEGGWWLRPCMACGGKHKFKECPEWKQVQVLIKDDKKKEENWEPIPFTHIVW